MVAKKRGRAFGHEVTPETRAKIAAALKGRAPNISAEARARGAAKRRGVSQPGHPQSEEAKAKISAGHLARRAQRQSTPEQDRATFHAWLRNNHPKTGVCEFCGIASKRTEHAFKFHPEPWTHNREDYFELCTKCHRGFDTGDRMMALKFWAEAGRPGRLPFSIKEQG